MRVVLAFDKFKGSATASELSAAARDALDTVGGIDVRCVPLADGGDGTTQVLASTLSGQWITVSTMPPLLSLMPVEARYFLCDDGTAIIEVAAASGLALVPNGRRDVMQATTVGTGLLMRDAIERGCRHIVLGLGGSATCDAAMGILATLGVEFTDAAGHYLFPSGKSLEHIARIETGGVPTEVQQCRFTLLADVDNPLCGPNGTVAVYAPQKGASPHLVEQLERGIQHVAEIVGSYIALMPGSGAAGGIPSLMLHLLDCELNAGAQFVLDRCGMDEALEGADLVITGEGRLDRQTLMGKGPGRVIAMARERGIPVAAVCGALAPDFDPVQAGLVAVEAVSDGLPLDEAMDHDGTLSRVAAATLHLTTTSASL